MFIKPAQGNITSPYGLRLNPWSKKQEMHWGIDIGNHANNAILAAGSGTVRFVDNSTRTSYGKYLIITHANGFETLYAHLSSISVKVGQAVKQGQQIGVKGTTGDSTGVHLHFEVHAGRWNNKWSNAVDPQNYVEKAATSTPGETNSIVKYLDQKGVNSSFANRAKLADQHGIRNYAGTAAQNTELLKKLRSDSKPKGDQKTTSIVNYLKSIGQDSSFTNRAKLATNYGIKNYGGTTSQNTQLLNKLRA